MHSSDTRGTDSLPFRHSSRGTVCVVCMLAILTLTGSPFHLIVSEICTIQGYQSQLKRTWEVLSTTYLWLNVVSVLASRLCLAFLCSRCYHAWLVSCILLDSILPPFYGFATSLSIGQNVPRYVFHCINCAPLVWPSEAWMGEAAGTKWRRW
jgi:hypothetical protein